MIIPGYDAWLTTPPDEPEVSVECDECGYNNDAYNEGEECPDCGEGKMREELQE